MKQKLPPMPMAMRVPNKNPGPSAPMSSSKTASYNAHLSAGQGAIMSAASKNVGK